VFQRGTKGKKNPDSAVGYSGWAAVVPLSSGGRKTFYAQSRKDVEDKVGQWRIDGGEAGEIARRAAGTKAQRPGAPSRTSATDWLLAWAHKQTDAWGPRRQYDAQRLIARVQRKWGDLPLESVNEARVIELLDAFKPTEADNLSRLLHVAFASRSEPNPLPVPSLRQRRLLQHSRRKMRILTAEEYTRLLRAAVNSARPGTFATLPSDAHGHSQLHPSKPRAPLRERWLSVAIVVAMETGLRSEEVRGLKFRDLRLRTGTIQVRQVVTRGLDGLQIELPKSDAGLRDVPIRSLVIDLLRDPPFDAVTVETDYVEGYGEYAVAHGDWKAAADLLVWATKDGSPLDPGRLTRELHRILDLTDIGLRCSECGADLEEPWGSCPAPRCYSENPRPTLHDLRHGHCSFLISRGLDPITVKTRLGWQSLRMLDRYAHLIGGGETGARRALDDIEKEGAEAIARTDAEREGAGPGDGAVNPDDVPF
jgi:integrase